MSDFTDNLKEHNYLIAEALAETLSRYDRRRELYELKICELESDLENAQEDLENEKRLNETLKMKLDKIFSREEL